MLPIIQQKCYVVFKQKADTIFFCFALTLQTSSCKDYTGCKFVSTCESPQSHRVKIVSFRKNVHVAEYVVSMEPSGGAQQLNRH